MDKKKNIFAGTDIDILSSIEFDLSEAIKDLIYNIKTIKEDVELLKKQIKTNKGKGCKTHFLK